MLDYKVLKSNIIRCLEPVAPNHISFTVNFEKMQDFKDNIGVVPVAVGLKSRHVENEDIPLLAEYFVGERLSWFEVDRRYTTLIMFAQDKLDDEAYAVIDKINAGKIEEPDFDNIHGLADLIARYPCYFATVVSYRNLDPKRIGKPSYTIICRCNRVMMRDQNYKYNPRDMS